MDEENDEEDDLESKSMTSDGEWASHYFEDTSSTRSARGSGRGFQRGGKRGFFKKGKGKNQVYLK